MPELVCDLTAIPADERERHGQRWQQLLSQKLSHTPHGEGYALTFPADAVLLTLLVQVIHNERLCCPFLDFAIDLPAGTPVATLRMTGPAGTQQLLAHELGLGA
jgi:hypothetical protein